MPRTLARRALWALVFAIPVAEGVVLAVSDREVIRRFAALDFYDYYYAGRAVLEGWNPYDAARADALALAEGVPIVAGSDFIYPAWFAAAVAPLAALPPRAAAWVWFALSALVLLAALRRGLVPHERPALALAAVLFTPTLFTLSIGQVNMLLLGLLVAAWRLRDDRPRLAGAALGLAAAIKLTPLVLLLPALLWRRGRLLRWALTTTLFALALGEVVVPGSTRAYFTAVLPSLSALPPRLAHPVNQGLGGALLRLLSPNEWTQPWWVAPALVRPLWRSIALGLTLLTTVLVVRESRRPDAREHLAWSAFVALQVVVSPLGWESTYVLLLLPMALTVATRDRLLRGAAALAWLLLAAHRALGDFSIHPQAHPVMRAFPPLTMLGFLGGLAVLAAMLARLWRPSALDDVPHGVTPPRRAP